MSRVATFQGRTQKAVKRRLQGAPISTPSTWHIPTRRHERPFDGLDAHGFTKYVVERGHRPKMGKYWPPPFCALLRACWHEEPAVRPSMASVCATLRALIDSNAAAAGPSLEAADSSCSSLK